MSQLSKKQSLNNFVTFFEKKCYWMGEPLIIIKYNNSNDNFFTIVNDEEKYHSFNIYLNKVKYWDIGKCDKITFREHINYLSNTFNTKKHELLYYKYDIRILLFHLQL